MTPWYRSGHRAAQRDAQWRADAHQQPAFPTKQAPDAAPRWPAHDQTIPLWDYSSSDQLQGDGTAPLNVYFRIPPDLYYDTEARSTRLHLVYRYDSIPIGPISSMQVRINNAFLGSTPLVPRAGRVAPHADRCRRSCRESAPILQYALIRFHIPVAQETKLR